MQADTHTPAHLHHLHYWTISDVERLRNSPKSGVARKKVSKTLRQEHNLPVESNKRDSTNSTRREGRREKHNKKKQKEEEVTMMFWCWWEEIATTTTTTTRWPPLLMLVLLLVVSGVTDSLPLTPAPPPPAASPHQHQQPCSLHSLGLVCNYNKVTPRDHQEEQVLDLWEWSGVKSVFVHHGNNLRLRGASCTNLHLYNTSASFTDSPSEDESTSCRPRNVHLQYSRADRIPGKLKELDVLYSRLERLENLEGLDRAYIVSSKVSRAVIQNLTEADIKIVDSEIECLKGSDVGYGTSLNFVGSNVTLAEDNGAVVVLKGGSLTLQRSCLVSPRHHQNTQPVVVKQGGSFSVFASTEPLTFFNPTLVEEVEELQQPAFVAPAPGKPVKWMAAHQVREVVGNQVREVVGNQVTEVAGNPVRGVAGNQVSGAARNQVRGVGEEEHRRMVEQQDNEGEEIPPCWSASATLSSSTSVLLVCLALTGAEIHKYRYFYK